MRVIKNLSLDITTALLMEKIASEKGITQAQLVRELVKERATELGITLDE